MKPFHILLFTVLVMLGLASVSCFFPLEGVTVLGQKISFPNLLTYFSTKENEKTDISKIVALADAEDKLTDEDTLKPSNDSVAKKAINYTEVNDPAIKLITSIQYKDSSKMALYNFFESLAAVQSDDKSIRILHYGDSQIEGDRITDYLRQKLQAHFGGSGPGMIAAVPVTQSAGIRQSWSDNWDRYTMFAAIDKRVPHKNFGVAAGLCRFADYKDTTSNKKAWLKIKTYKNAGTSVSNYNKVKMFYAAPRKKTQVEFYENGTLQKTDTLSQSGNFNVKQFNLTQEPNTFEIK